MWVGKHLYGVRDSEETNKTEIGWNLAHIYWNPALI